MIAIAIDGPAGAGKSTMARAAAAALGFIYVDTGALYRAVGLHMLEKGIVPRDADAVKQELGNVQVSLEFQQGEQHVFLCGKDVSQEIRTPEVSMAASAVSAIPEVRAFLFDLQKNMAKTHSVIMDGRDIGTVVLPQAQVKIFLTASDEERANRRYRELLEKGKAPSYEEVLSDLRKRDYDDSHRAAAPLKPAEDAVLVDTTGMSLEESIEKILAVIRQKLSDKTKEIN